MSLPPGWGGADSRGRQSVLATRLGGAAGTWVRTDRGRCRTESQWQCEMVSSLSAEVLSSMLTEIDASCRSALPRFQLTASFAQGAEEGGRGKWCQAVTVQNRLQKRRMYSVGHSLGCSQEKETERLLCPFWTQFGESPDSAWWSYPFPYCHPTSPGFEVPQLVLGNCFYSDFLK